MFSFLFSKKGALFILFLTVVGFGVWLATGEASPLAKEWKIDGKNQKEEARESATEGYGVGLRGYVPDAFQGAYEDVIRTFTGEGVSSNPEHVEVAPSLQAELDSWSKKTKNSILGQAKGIQDRLEIPLEDKTVTVDLSSTVSVTCSINKK